MHREALDLTKNILREKVEYLNKTTGSNHSDRFWWLLVSPWFYQFVNQLLLYSVVIESALKNLPEKQKLICQIISPNSWTQFFDTLQALNAWKGHRQNHEMLSFLLWIRDTNQLELSINELATEQLILKKNTRRKIFDAIYKHIFFPLMAFISRALQTKVFGFGTPSESVFTDFCLLLKSHFSIIPIYSVKDEVQQPRKVDIKRLPKRGSIKNLHSEFNTVVDLAFELFCTLHIHN